MRSIQEGSDLLPGLLPAGLGQVHCTWYSIEIARWKILTALLRFRNDGVEDDLFRQNMFKVKSLLVRWVESIAVPLFVNRGRTMLSSAEMLSKGHCSAGAGIQFCWHLLAPINTSCRYRLWYHCRVWRRLVVLQLNRLSADALWHRASPKGLQGEEVQAGEALTHQGGLCPHHEKLAGLLHYNW